MGLFTTLSKFIVTCLLDVCRKKESRPLDVIINETKVALSRTYLADMLYSLDHILRH